MKRFDRASEALHRLTMGESVLGEGRTDEFPPRTIQVPESGLDYVLVTASRILVAKDTLREDRSWDFELSWEQVHEFADRDLGHQWLLLLRHDPIVRTNTARSTASFGCSGETRRLRRPKPRRVSASADARPLPPKPFACN
jgi:hypothetical protein